MKLSADDLGRQFREKIVRQQWCDEAYAQKTWDQGSTLRDRAEFLRKVTLLLAWANVPGRVGKAKLLFHEIAGFVNDRGAMQNRITPQEIEARRLFREESGQPLEAA